MLLPFQGWVYREQPRVAPVIDALPPEQMNCLRQDPYQALHIAFPTETTALPLLWEHWRSHHVLQREPLPTLYAYSQTFYRYGQGKAQQRVGFIGVIPLSAPLLPHEGTLPERVAGLQAALQGLPVQSTPVHLLAEGAWASLNPLIQGYLSCPRFVYGGSDGVMHRWSPIHHRGHQKQIYEAFAQSRFLIADGHHRWQAAQQQRLPYLLVYLTPIEDPTLLIIPTHRFLAGAGFSLGVVEPYFEVRPSAARIPLWRELEGLRHAIGLVSPEGKSFTARLRPTYWPLLQERPLVAWLHEWFLDRVCPPGQITFSREPSPLIEAALEGKGWAFLLPPLSIQQVMKAASEGIPLPPKATYFFPKVLSGLCFYHESDTGFSVTPP